MIIMSSSSGKGHTLSSPQQLVTYLLDQSNPEHNIASLEHRQQVISTWNIQAGSTVLEIGCGQGDFTVVLADAVGEEGRIVAVDPSPPDWGTPKIVEAQAHLGNSPIGSRIEFLNEDPITYLSSLDEDTSTTFDYIVFGHSIWFFPGPGVLPSMLRKARPHARSVLVAEFSLATSLPAAFPHVLAAQYNATLESVADRAIWNVRCALTPAQITRAVEGAGWALAGAQRTVTPSAALLDAWREVSMVLRAAKFREELERARLDERVRTVLFGMRDAVAASVERLDGGLKAVRNMDVWIARFDAPER